MTDEHVNKIDKVDLSSCIMMLRGDGIMHIDFKKIEELKVKDVMEIVKVLEQNGERKKYPTLITVKQFISIEKEVRELWANPKRSNYSLADALVVAPVAIKMVANFYIAVNKPAIPTRVFNSEEKAVEWLKTFL